MLVDSSVIDFFKNEMVLVKVNADVDSMLAREYHVSGYPTVVLTNKDGVEIDRIVGFLPSVEFLKTLRDYEKGIGTLDDLVRRADTLTDRLLFFQIANKYKYRDRSEEAQVWYQRVIDEGEPTDSLSGESHMALADMMRRAKDYDRALVAFGEIKQKFVGSMFAEGADIYTAIVYKQKGDTAQAIAAFENFIKWYPESEDVEYAAKQIEKLKPKPESN